jgi:hypothetical protein
VAIELARHGIEVVGTDIDGSMLATAQRLEPDIEWVQADLCELELGRAFDLVVMAGNVPLFASPGTEAALVAGVARHVAPAGRLVSGFNLGRNYSLAELDRHGADNGLVLEDRFATWDRQPWIDGGDYAVSVHRRQR